MVLNIAAALVVRPFQDVPFLDDWTYAWSVEWLLQHGELKVLDWSAHLNMFHIIWGALFCIPFGFSFAALRASTFVLSLSCQLALYHLLRDAGVSRRDARIGTAVLAVNPIFFVLSFSFMTDIPFLAAVLWCAVATARALRRQTNGPFVLALLLACVAIGIRLVGAVLPVAIALTFALAPGGLRGNRWRSLAALLPLLFLALLLAWASAATHHVAQAQDFATTSVVAARLTALSWALPFLPRALITTISFVAVVLGGALLPLTAAALRGRSAPRASVVLGGLTAIFVIGELVGSPAPLAFDRPAIWSLVELGIAEPLVPAFQPNPLPLGWSAVTTIAAVSSSAIWFAVVTRVRPGPSEEFLVWLLLGYAAAIAVLWFFHDRYALPLFPAAIALFLGANSLARPKLAIAIIAMFGALSLVGMRDHLGYSRALWQAVQELHARGAADSEIDGGYVVNGWPALRASRARRTRYGRPHHRSHDHDHVRPAALSHRQSTDARPPAHCTVSVRSLARTFLARSSCLSAPMIAERSTVVPARFSHDAPD